MLVSQIRKFLSCSSKSGVMEQTLKNFGFTAFERIEDLGFFCWFPRGNYKKLHEVSAAELRHGVRLRGTPPEVQPISDLNAECPCTLNGGKTKNKKRTTRNEYPYNPSYLVPLYVAVAGRNVRPGDVDFLFGGSVLHALATGKTSGRDVEYRVQQVPGTSIVLVEKHQEFTTNWDDAGHLFEEFVWGGHYRTCGAKNQQVTYEHLQRVVINGHNILISAESDGMDHDGNAVEIKCSNPKNWKGKVAFQMISNGSTRLYWGEIINPSSNKKKGRGTKLQSVNEFSFKEILDMSIRKDAQPNGLRQLEKRLCANLDVLAMSSRKGDLEDGRVCTLDFTGASLELRPVSLLPTESVVHDLLFSTDAQKKKNDAREGETRTTTLETRIASGTLTERDHAFLDSMPDEMAVGYGYIPEDFCGFGSD